MNCSGLTLSSPWRVPLVQPATTSGRPLDTGTATARVPRPGQSLGSRQELLKVSAPNLPGDRETTRRRLSFRKGACVPTATVPPQPPAQEAVSRPRSPPGSTKKLLAGQKIPRERAEVVRLTWPGQLPRLPGGLPARERLAGPCVVSRAGPGLPLYKAHRRALH